MGSTPTEPPVFTRGSHVLDYWLAHAEGFRVKSRRPWRAQVDSVIHDPESGQATALVLRSLLAGRRRTVGVEAVAAVKPADGVLFLQRRPQPQHVRPSLRAASASAGSAIAAQGSLARATLAAAASWLQPRLGHTATLAARLVAATTTGADDARRWLQPRLALGARSAAATALAVSAALIDVLGRGLARLQQTPSRANGTRITRKRALREMVSQLTRAPARTAEDRRQPPDTGASEPTPN